LTNRASTADCTSLCSTGKPTPAETHTVKSFRLHAPENLSIFTLWPFYPCDSMVGVLVTVVFHLSDSHFMALSLAFAIREGMA